MNGESLKVCRRLMLIRGYPREEHDLVVEELLRFIDAPEKLSWLIATVLRHVRFWPGIAELRALYATRYAPADGEPAEDCSIPGFTPDDNERAYREAIGDESMRQLEQWKQAARELPAAEQLENRRLLSSVEDRAREK